MPERPERPNDAAHKEIFEAGLAVRRKVLGDAWVDNMLKAENTDFMTSMQLAAWGTIWTRPLLGRNMRGAVRNGLSELEIQETLLQTAVYAGLPKGLHMFRIADECIKEFKEEGLLPK